MIKLARIGFGLLVSAAALTLTQSSGAGESGGSGNPFCWTYNGSGSCEGTLLTFRTSSDPNAYASVMTWGNGGMFAGNVNGAGGSCTIQPSQIAEFQTLLTSPPQTYFFVEWNSTGACTYLEIGAFSADF